jgi:putative aldouronate transport system substrate-binding protein
MKRNWFILMALILIVSTLLSACSGAKEETSAGKSEVATKQNEGESAKAAEKTDEKPLDISIMTIYYSAEPPGKDNVITKEVEKRTNTKLDITWVSPNSYNDKVNVTLASGSIPDLMLVTDPFSAQVRTLVQQGAFWDLTPFLQDYPNLMNFPEESWNNTKQADGKNYGIPRVRPVEGGGFFYLRKDWMDKLGLEVPQTNEELYNVLKAFVQKDPDGNGQADTVGWAGYVNQDNMGNLGHIQNVFAQVTGDWKIVDGKLVNINVLPEIRNMLIWLQQAYKDKVIPEDFAVLKHNQGKDMVKGNRAGAFGDTVEAAWEPTEELRKANPDADFLPLVSIDGYTNRDGGSFGMFLIPKSVPEDKMKKLLEFMNYGASDEGHELAWYGFPDIHHTVQDGIYQTTEQAAKDIVAQQAFGQIFGKYDKYQRAYRAGMPIDVYKRNMAIIDERAKVSVPSPAVGLYSETWTKVGPEINKKIQDMKTKVILGQEGIEAWDALVAELQQNSDFIKITEETNEAYAKRQ